MTLRLPTHAITVATAPADTASETMPPRQPAAMPTQVIAFWSPAQFLRSVRLLLARRADAMLGDPSRAD